MRPNVRRLCRVCNRCNKASQSLQQLLSLSSNRLWKRLKLCWCSSNVNSKACRHWRNSKVCLVQCLSARHSLSVSHLAWMNCNPTWVRTMLVAASLHLMKAAKQKTKIRRNFVSTHWQSRVQTGKPDCKLHAMPKRRVVLLPQPVMLLVAWHPWLNVVLLPSVMLLII